MPDSSNRYQLPSWPPTKINRDLWNAVLGDVADRISAREDLEASFEALIEQGTQASLDYIQATIAPQISSLQTSIQLAQEQIEQIIEGGTAPNAAKLGNQFPSYYASVDALNSGLGLKADATYVDDALLLLANSTQDWLDLKANASEMAAALADKAALLSSGTLDNTFDDTSELAYVDGTTQKRGTLTGLISSIFKSTRALADGVFLAASFAWQNAGGFKRTHNIAGHTANRVTTWPDGNVTIPAGTMITGSDVAANVAAISAGGIGSIVLAAQQTGAAIAFGATVAGSSLITSNVGSARGSALSGTYRCLGTAATSETPCVFMRIS